MTMMFEHRYNEEYITSVWR